MTVASISSVHGQPDDLLHIAEGGLAAHGGDLAVDQLVHVHQPQIQHVDDAGLKDRFVYLLNSADLHPARADDLDRVLHHGRVPHDQGIAERKDLRVGQRHHGDFRADAGRVAHGDADDRFFHTAPPFLK